ncbi:uncharacterized protein LOC133520334 [Cydia pomonella]|uniref:uncharacterized protein LOC133520334 n=1 Tax=Cydia pomonella TaxID=82600 RepID=UPI002ADE6A1F|nr:uncharacterized protein LOC133520334 [Cydia pomonella]
MGWGASADCLRTSGIALVYSAAEYCAPVWLGSAHTNKVDVKLHDTMRCISGTIKSTPVHWLPLLSHVAPPHLRRAQALKREVEKILKNPTLPAHKEFCYPPPQRLVSRNPPCAIAPSLSNFNILDRWKDEWSTATVGKDDLYLPDPTKKPKGFHLPRKIWCRLNRLRTGHGRCNYFQHKWAWKESPLCECGEEEQTIEHIFRRCPLHFYPGPAEDLDVLTPDVVTWLNNLKAVL